jgi:hypothetical protein
MGPNVWSNGEETSNMSLVWFVPKPRVLGLSYLVLGEIPFCNVPLFLFWALLPCIFAFFLFSCTNLLYMLFFHLIEKKKNTGRGIPLLVHSKKNILQPTLFFCKNILPTQYLNN